MGTPAASLKDALCPPVPDTMLRSILNLFSVGTRTIELEDVEH